jgi:hypothetical protein
MIASLLIIRLKQLIRSLRHVGPIRILILLAIVALGILMIYENTSDSPTVYFTLTLYILTILFIHAKRVDRTFLGIIGINSRFAMLVEYAFLSVPLLLILMLHKQWLPILLLVVLLPMVVQLNPKLKIYTLNTWLQRQIPNSYFEWKSGARRYLLAGIIVWLAGLSTSFYLGSIPLVIIFLGVITLSFYEVCEPLPMVLALEKPFNKFIKHKIASSLLMVNAIYLPLVVLQLLLHPEYWYIPLGLVFLISNLHAYAVLVKYAFYNPNSKRSAPQLFVAVGFAGLLFPFIIPMVWLLCIWFYFKSKLLLTPSLNDYN